MPGLHEHYLMAYPRGEDSAAEEAGESPAQEAAEAAAGQS